MKLICKKCGMVMQSLLIIQGEACTEVGQKLTAHVQKYHVEEFNRLQNDGAMTFSLVMCYLLTKRFAKIPNNEEFFQKNFDTVVDKMMELLGFELGKGTGIVEDNNTSSNNLNMLNMGEENTLS